MYVVHSETTMVKTRTSRYEGESDDDSETSDNDQLEASVNKFVDLVVAKAEEFHWNVESEEEDEEVEGDTYSLQEIRYLNQCSPAKRQKLSTTEAELNALSNVPFRFQVLESEHSEDAKCRMLSLLDSKDNKSRASVEAALRIPIRKHQAIPSTPLSCAQKLQEARSHLDDAVHGWHSEDH